jgi:methionyl-tRNA formyltransferase
MTRPFHIVFMGTPDFAVPILRALAGDKTFSIDAVVTQPDRATGRKQALTPPPVKRVAQELGLFVLQPEKVGAPDVLEQIRALNPDVIVTAAYGQLLPQRLLDIPRCGCLNVHASLLPRWRGAAPIHRAIMAGDQETGVTIMEMVKALDAGPIVAAETVPITDRDTVGTLHDKLAECGARLLLRVLPDYLEGRIKAVPQPESGVTYADRIAREDEFLDWSWSTEKLHNHIRGLSPWPGAVTSWQGKDFKVWLAEPAQVAEPELVTVPVGTVVGLAEQGVCVKTGDGWLRLLEVQPAGKRRMSAEDWLRGVADQRTQFSAIGVWS